MLTSSCARRIAPVAGLFAIVPQSRLAWQCPVVRRAMIDLACWMTMTIFSGRVA